jgi:hypothetical protein
MALTRHQRDVCRLLAGERRARGESYVAGGAALGAALGTPRLSLDVDIFHDTLDAVGRSSERDRTTLEGAGYAVRLLRDRPGYVEALVTGVGGEVVLEWTRDSAFRFFPLVEHADLGLALHPFDLATNKVLALIGRLEVRDWIDAIECHERLQPLGYLAWAASGKDPGFSPLAILEHAGRSSRYTQVEVDALAFDGVPPSAADLSRRWHDALDTASAIVAALPVDEVGRVVCSVEGALFTGGPEDLDGALAAGTIRFHAGRIGGAWPSIKP